MEEAKKPMGRKRKVVEDVIDMAIRKYVDEFQSTSSKEIAKFLKSNSVGDVSHKLVYGRIKRLGIPLIKKAPGPAAQRYRRTTKYLENEARKRLLTEKKGAKKTSSNKKKRSK